jgi:adenine/guanine phosphoribosyltransferase-like PRPP-binding protein
MNIPDTNDPEALALAALAWSLADQPRAERLLALTGLTPDDLRARLGDRRLLAAVIGFLETHEPDLIACAEALGVSPAALVEAGRRLEQ